MTASASRVLIALAIAGSVVAGVAACGSESAAAPTKSPSPTASATATPEPTASATAAPVGTPVDIDCNALVTPQAVYDFNPNFTLDAGYKPARGTQAADIVAMNGLACGWVNQTSGEIIEVAVANLPDEKLTELKNAFVTSSNSVPTYGVEGYFKLDGTTGEAEAFGGPYWISASSASFYEPGDAVMIVDAALAGLGQ
jgi:hypothetical protein